MFTNEARKLWPVFYTCGPGKQEVFYETEGACKAVYEMDDSRDRNAYWGDVAKCTGNQHLTPEEMEAKAYRDVM